MAEPQAAQAATDAAQSGLLDLLKVLLPAAVTGAAAAWANSTRKIGNMETKVAGLEVSVNGLHTEVAKVSDRVDRIYDHLVARAAERKD